MLSQKNITNALYRYLYENLEPEGIGTFANIFYEDFSKLTKWVVIQPLNNTLGVNPRQLYFIHCAVANTGENANDELCDIIDLLMPLLDGGSVVDVYAYPDEDEIVGAMMVSDCSLGPQLAHGTGSIKQTYTVSFVYEGF